ncbi:MAG: biotin/lipoyl-containing protein [archaeon]
MSTYDVTIDGHSHRVVVPTTRGELFEVLVDGISFRVKSPEKLTVETPLPIEIDSTSYLVRISTFNENQMARVTIDNTVMEARAMLVEALKTQEIPEETRHETKPHEQSAIVTAPLPGRVVDIKVNLGQQIAEGAALVMIESMKMENEIRSPKTGVVTKIHVSKNTDVKRGDSLVTVQ